ncbi:MAG: hypothetical protein J6D29_03595 [Solobacterium sp.]|nr:hypothetical protein [Solobacterium sp.]
MKNYEIIKLRTRYIVPFEYDIDDASFEEICERIDNHQDFPYAFFHKENHRVEGHWVRSSLLYDDQDLYTYIANEFCLTGPIDYSKNIDKMGLYWKYEYLTDEHFEMLFSYDTYLDKDSKTIPLSIIDMGLYVFRSGVGLIWYETDLDETKTPTSLELIHFQNLFKELSRGKNNHIWLSTDKLQVQDSGQEYVPFMLGTWLVNRLSFLNVSFPASNKNYYTDLLRDQTYSHLTLEELQEKTNWLNQRIATTSADKALLFTYAVFKKDSADWKKDYDTLRTVYYLTNGYRETYEMTEQIGNMIKNPFSNLYWSADIEGCGYFAWASEENKLFFMERQYVRIMRHYFLLYIRGVYQSASLMRYAVYTSTLLPNRYESYISINDDTEKLSQLISMIGARINLFIVKSIVTTVSHITHQNEFYSYIIERLKIKEDVASVTAGLAALNELQQETVMKKQDELERSKEKKRQKESQHEKRSANRFQIGLGLISFLAAISAITDTYYVVYLMSHNTIEAPWTYIFGTVSSICIIILIVSIVIFVQSVREITRQDKEQ